MIILIDNYDSFTFNVYHYFSELGANLKVFRNDQIEINEIIKLNPKAIIISPGPCTPNEAGISVDLIKKIYLDVPILGICLGHQSIGQAFGGEIVQCEEIIHGKKSNNIHNNHKLINKQKNNFMATRYHSLIIKNNSLNQDFEIIAKTKKNIIMGIAHKKKNIYGLEFHPESIGTLDGKIILKNFLDIIKYEI